MTMRRALAFLFLVLAPLAALAEGAGLDFRSLEPRLHLTPGQKMLYDEAVAASQRAMLATSLAALEVKGRLDQELRKPRPDFARILGDPGDLLDQVRPQWREAREAWTALYETLDARQAAIARDYVERRLGTFDDAASLLLRGLRDRMQP